MIVVKMLSVVFTNYTESIIDCLQKNWMVQTLLVRHIMWIVVTDAGECCLQLVQMMICAVACLRIQW